MPHAINIPFYGFNPIIYATFTRGLLFLLFFTLVHGFFRFTVEQWPVQLFTTTRT